MSAEKLHRIQFPDTMEVYGFGVLMHTLTGGDGF